LPFGGSRYGFSSLAGAGSAGRRRWLTSHRRTPRSALAGARGGGVSPLPPPALLLPPARVEDHPPSAAPATPRGRARLLEGDLAQQGRRQGGERSGPAPVRQAIPFNRDGHVRAAQQGQGALASSYHAPHVPEEELRVGGGVFLPLVEFLEASLPFVGRPLG